MRRICQQSRRWHQQFFPFASHLGHRQCLQRLWLPTQYQQRQYARSRDDDVVVHMYEQLGANKKTRVAVDPKAELEETGEYLKSKIQGLEKELAEMRKGPFGPDSEFMRSLSPEEREIALKILLQEGEAPPNELDEIDTAELDRLVEDQDLEKDDIDHELAPHVILKYAKEQQAYVRYFNAALKDMLDDSPTKAKKVALWQSYQRCRRHIPNFDKMVPIRVWDLLWASQTEPSDRYRAVKVLMLAKHMRSESAALSPQQLLIYMESLQSIGNLQLAIECWNENRSTLGPNAEVAQQFWGLGVKLYSESDRPEEAQDIAMQCLDRGSFVDANVLLPLIESWARKGTMDDLQKAWACYLRFKVELGSAIRAEDYETISTALLNQGQPDMALAVFKDMALDEAKHEGYDSVSAFRKVAGLVGDLQSSSVNEHEVSKVSLTALTVLPRFLQNKYFYASWIKTLIGLEQVDAASKVVELMYERGIRPDAKHLNGIIGAWLRDGSHGSRDKAEQLGWAMVNARLDFVRERQRGTRSQKQNTTPEGRIIPTFVHRLVPPATIETFSVLLLHYTRRCQEDLAEQLMEVMTKQAMMEPNAFIWNHWLYASLRVRDIERVWSQYQTMKVNVQPDLETFACLWDTAKLNGDLSKSAHSNKFPVARRVFKEMDGWMLHLPERPLIHAKQEFSRDLHDQIIRAFCLSGDLRGILCALHGLKQLFGEYPDQATTRIIAIQIARLLPPDPGHVPSGRRGMRTRFSKMHTALSAVNEILQIVSDQRAVALMDAGVDPQNLDEAATKQFQLDVLSDLLVVVLRRLGNESNTVDNEVHMVAKLMGVNVEGIDFRKTELFGSGD